ncbi:MAG TPA: ribosomal protein S18-alanine N-acetyltransferase [Candidatus Kapabacteria bacterium]|nr:ribosomal protein S18-alanine N-acetyltransferase [Candidatus Kapabacteria bacterium]
MANRNIDIRKTQPGDIDAVYYIKKEQFTNPWKKKFFYDELNHDISFFYVAEDAITKKICGYIIFWIIEETLELHDIAVIENYKNRGVGSQLMNFMLEIARIREVEEIFLEVRLSNAAAIAFYEKFNFKKIDVRKNYYSEPIEDAAVYGLYLK